MSASAMFAHKINYLKIKITGNNLLKLNLDRLKNTDNMRPVDFC